MERPSGPAREFEALCVQELEALGAPDFEAFAALQDRKARLLQVLAQEGGPLAADDLRRARERNREVLRAARSGLRALGVPDEPTYAPPRGAPR